MILTSLVSVAILGTGFFASQPTFVRASEEAAEKASAEADAQKEFLANYDEALEVTVKELEKADTKNNPELEAQKQKTIEALKAASAETRAKIVEGFKNGLTAKQAEKIIDEANKKASEEAAEKASAEASTPKPGWKQENGMWYFYNTDGAMVTGWIQYNGSWYYLNRNGAMATGWAKVNGSWYYLNRNGAMATGWVKDGDTRYYLEASGAMKASQWFKVLDKWYYVNGSGALAVNTTVDGYRESMLMVNGFKPIKLNHVKNI